MRFILPAGGSGMSFSRAQVASALASLALSCHPAAANPIPVKIDPGIQYQEFEGWGTSLSWWAHDLGERDSALAQRTVGWMTDPDTGLGFTIFRYNIGGGEAPQHKHIPQHRRVPGFKPTESGPYDWNADAGQRLVLRETLRRVPKAILEAQSNSPPYWMTKSGCAAGDTDGSDNLKEDSYPAFADYLTEVVKHFHDFWGADFRTLAPMNEPNSGWWKSGNNQEGCAFSIPHQIRILAAAGKSLKDKGLSSTALSAADANSMEETRQDLKAYDAATLALLSQINTHSYYGFDSRRALSDLAVKSGKRIWQSESGPLSGGNATVFDACLFMSDVMLKDLRDLRANAWVDWQVQGEGPWGAITSKGPNLKFHFYAAFTRFIRPGSRFIGCKAAGDSAATAGQGAPGNTDVNMVAVLAPSTGNLVLVAVNTGAQDQDYLLDLSAFPKLPAAARVFRASEKENLIRLPDLGLSGGPVAFRAAARSVTTVAMENAAGATLMPVLRATRRGLQRDDGFLGSSRGSRPRFGSGWRGEEPGFDLLGKSWRIPLP